MSGVKRKLKEVQSTLSDDDPTEAYSLPKLPKKKPSMVFNNIDNELEAILELFASNEGLSKAQKKSMKDRRQMFPTTILQ